MMNAIAFGILVITLIVNICIQLATGAIFVFCMEHAFIMFIMLVLFIMMNFSALTIPVYMECKFSANGGPNELGVRIGDQEVPKSDRFRYLGSILQKNGELDGDLNHRIQAGWMKWKSASSVLCDRRMPLNLKGKFYRTAIRPAILYGTECWAVKHQHVHKMGVAEMRMLRWMCGHSRKDKIKNEDIRGKVGVAEIEGKMRENMLRWFGHVQRRPTDAPVRRCDHGTEVQGRRGRGRPRKTLE